MPVCVPAIKWPLVLVSPVVLTVTVAVPSRSPAIAPVKLATPGVSAEP